MGVSVHDSFTAHKHAFASVSYGLLSVPPNDSASAPHWIPELQTIERTVQVPGKELLGRRQ